MIDVQKMFCHFEQGFMGLCSVSKSCTTRKTRHLFSLPIIFKQVMVRNKVCYMLMFDLDFKFKLQESKACVVCWKCRFVLLIIHA